MKLTISQTIQHFIEELEADMAEISYNINDEIDSYTLEGDDADEGWHQTQMEQLCDDYDEKQDHLNNLKEIKKQLFPDV
jgi:hypothetical protein